MENRVRFKIGEIEFEAEGTAEVIERERIVFLNSLLPAAVDAIVRTRGADRTVQFLEDSETPTLLGESNVEEVPTNMLEVADTALPRTSLASYVSRYGHISDQDFAILAAYYDEKKNGVVSFSSETVKQYYNDARRSKYSNISELLRQLAQKRLIMDDPKSERKAPKQYILSAEGIKYAETFQPKGESEKKVVKSRKPHIKAKSEYSGINIDELNLQNYPEIKALKAFKEKMMMVLYIITNEKAGEWFTTADVLYLMTDVFGEAATENQVKGVFKREKLWFKIENVGDNKRDVKRKLLNKGIEYAQSLMAEQE